MLKVAQVRAQFRDHIQFELEVTSFDDVRTVAHALALYILCDVHGWDRLNAENWLWQHQQGRHFVYPEEIGP